MHYYTFFLKHPVTRFFLTPFGYALFGCLIGATTAGKFNWYATVLLYIILVSSQFIDRYFHVQFNPSPYRSEPISKMPLLISEGALWLSTILFILSHHWAANLLVLIYAAAIHLQYFPHNMQHTSYQVVLNSFFYAFILNNIAYFSQTGTIDNRFLLYLIPLILLQLGFQIERLHLYIRLYGVTHLTFTGNTLTLLCQSSVAMSLLGMLYFAWPSHSFFIAELLAFGLIALTLLPLLVHAKTSQHIHNKVAYLTTAFFMISLAYAVSIIF